jgi:hypothetical protein
VSIYRIGAGSVSGTTLTTCVNVGTGTTATVANMVLTNTGATVTAVNVYVYSGATQRLLTVVKLPAGVGKSKIVFEAIGGISAGDSLRAQGDGASTFNYHVFGNTVQA